ncbi:chitin synthase-domain-containing protein [Gilbertella persicaria]|uniref:chitin synthase-domain-containing protein n=1 Tax=Gilbertella persicaria TaxID=101096 RepID=UPI002220F046|nr:chitin synthase-domain-containing protein [Gilbertella persicaria]KAI8047960.1 chitin synthase-domain-containing protein [Gilbertella persicaria]
MLPDLCGFCCFSMRFVVLTDLIGTITLPVSFAYLVYLIYVIASGSGPLPVLALAMIAGSYGLQILIFILKRQWQHIGWMFFYIFSLPFTSFILPIYSFWHFDDFSWGNTRVVVGDQQRKIIVTDEEKFDEKMIPMKKWSVYEQELWEMGSHASGQTGMTGNTYSSYNKGGIVPPGYDARSQYSGSVAGGDFDYYRDSKIGEKLGRNTRQSSYAYNTAGPGSVVGSEYGSNNMIPMGDYGNRSMMATPPPGMPMRPMSYASADYMSQIQPMMGPNMYNNPMSFDPNTMGAPSPAFNQGQRNSSFDHVSTFSSHMINQQPAEYDIPMGNVSQVSVPPMMPAGFPADDEILHEIRNILATADLMSITKKQVREQLSQIFGCDMSFKKEFINSSIEQILQGHL